MREEKQINLRKAIFEVIAFFDLFDYFPNSFDIYRFLSLKSDQKEIENVLLLMQADSRIHSMEGSFSLREERFEYLTKNKRYLNIEKKLNICKKVSRIFSFIPWIKFIGLGNVIGSNNFKKKGDLDFFIVTAKNRVWLVRLLVVFITMILRLRPTKNNHQDKICLSFFVSEYRLNLDSLMIEKDIYMKYWLASLIPLYEKGDSYVKLISKNSWLFDFFPNWDKIILYPRFFIRKNVFVGSFSFLDYIESFLMLWQIKRLPKELKDDESKNVVYNKDVIKLHSNDRREQYRDKYFKKISNEI